MGLVLPRTWGGTLWRSSFLCSDRIGPPNWVFGFGRCGLREHHLRARGRIIPNLRRNGPATSAAISSIADKHLHDACCGLVIRRHLALEDSPAPPMGDGAAWTDATSPCTPHEDKSGSGELPFSSAWDALEQAQIAQAIANI